MHQHERTRIVSTFISNFRSFSPRDKKEGPNVTDLSDINIFVGPNSSGKTNYLNALRDTLGWHSFNSQGTYAVERNHHDAHLPIWIEITLQTDHSTRTATMRQPPVGYVQSRATRSPDPDEDTSLKERIFPIGLPRNFHEYNRRLQVNPTDTSYDRIATNWSKICDDAKSLGIDLRRSPPEPPLLGDDRFFFDMVDSNTISHGEGSDGVANVLCIVIGIRILPPGSVVIIEEPEVSMHPGLQKEFMDYLTNLTRNERYQFLLSTHSPYVMNYVLEKSVGSIFHFAKSLEGHTSITRVSGKQDSWHLLRDLGHSPADVLHANGVVWVEGPSDAIYVSSWLKSMAPDLHFAKDYTIMWYGGGLWKHLGAESWESTVAGQKLIDLFSLNPNWAFITDSDVQSGKSSIAEGMQLQKQEVISLCKRHGRYSWMIAPRIEECVKDSMGWNEYPPDKVPKAREYECLIQGFTPLEVERTVKPRELLNLKGLIETIRKWK